MTNKNIKIDVENFEPNNESLKYEIDVQKYYSNLIFANQEEQHFHNSYENEQRELYSIETGDIDMLKRCWEDIQPTSYGVFSKDRIRNIKNLCIVLVAFASRAAIRGGIQPEVAFSLCDSYALKIEESSEAIVIIQLTHRAELLFAKLVADIREIKTSSNKSKNTSHVEYCKKYIFAHLHDKLTVQSIADALHLNANYLSGLFKEQENQTILQFILNEKIKLAQNMLIYSNYTYSEIANYLGFSSQSHLGTCFKKNMQMTLGEYRSRFRPEEFNS